MNHERAIKSVYLGEFSDTPSEILEKVRFYLREWFDTKYQSDMILDRWNIGYPAMRWIAAQMNENLAQYGFLDSEGGMGVVEYILRRLDKHELPINR